MRLGIMQPYFFPYLGYFQLMAHVDTFVVYDNIEYTKKGWINRNRFVADGKIQPFTVNLRKASDSLPINRREIAPEFDKNRHRILRQIRAAYGQCSNFTEAFPLVEECFTCNERNLFSFLYFSIERIHAYLGLSSHLVVASDVNIDHTLRKSQKVMAICSALHCESYINPESGRHLYDKLEFGKQGIQLEFLWHVPTRYRQNSRSFIPRLSFIDVLMNNDRDELSCLLNDYEIL